MAKSNLELIAEAIAINGHIVIHGSRGKYEIRSIRKDTESSDWITDARIPTNLSEFVRIRKANQPLVMDQVRYIIANKDSILAKRNAQHQAFMDR